MTGSVGMAVRIIYQDMFGIIAEPDSLIIRPCLTKDFSGSIVGFSYRDKSIKIEYVYGDGQPTLNGKPLTLKNGVCTIKPDDFEDENKLLVYYK